MTTTKLRAAMAVLATLAALPLSSHAAPVELDTDAAHIIVVRPVDLWAGDASVQKDSLEAIRDHEVSYDLLMNGERYRGSPLVLQGVSDNPVTLGVQAALAAQNTQLVRKSDYLFHVLDATPLTPDDYQAFAKAQLDYRELFVEREGDPQTLQGRLRVHKFFGNLLSVGSLFIPVPGLSAGQGAEVMMSSGIAEDIGNIPGPARAALIPAALPAIDASAYKEIDVRRVDFTPEAPGEIIIAYKADKTPEAEQAALIKAIVTIAGADTTPEAVEAARKADFENRVSMWDACVANGKCQKEASNVEH
jgi:hypothetical protein